jgi:hypothetical protein
MSYIIESLSLVSYVIVGGCIIYNLYNINNNLMELEDTINGIFQK